MPTSVRLDPETESELERIARIREISKSDVIREAIHAYGAEIAPVATRTLADSWGEVIGMLASGSGDLTTDSHAKIAERIRARNRPSRSGFGRR